MTTPPAPRTHSASVRIGATPAQVYALVSDVTRTGEWSPVCAECWWDDGDGPRVGAHFTGRNVTPDRTWETRSEVVAATEGREFAWVVGPGVVRWGYLIEPADDTGTTTRLTETWEFTSHGQEVFVERYGDDAPAQIEQRTRAAHEGIPATLEAIRRVAEAEA